MNDPHIASEKGAALMLSMITLLTVSILVVSMFGVTRMMMRESLFQERAAQAQVIAEAGMEDALLQLRFNSSWRTGFTNKLFAGGSYSVSLSTDSSPQITSVGRSQAVPFLGPARATIQAQAQLTGGTTSQTCTTFSAGATSVSGSIDAYDSSVNPNPTTFGRGGHFCSNNNFGTKSSTYVIVNMDVNYFSGAAPSNVAVGGTVTKSTFTYTLLGHDGTPYVTLNDNAKLPPLYYTSGTKTLSIPLNATATVSSGTYYLNTLTVNGNLSVDSSSGPVILYTLNNFTLPNKSGTGNGEITNIAKIPSRLLFYPQNGSHISFSSKSPVFAVIDSPASIITIGQIFYGNMTGNSITINSGAIFHFDQASVPATSNMNHVGWSLNSWSSN